MTETEKKSTVYVAGNWDNGNNIMEFVDAIELLRKKEFIPMSRVGLPTCFSWEDAKDIIAEMIMVCSSFCLLPGWEQSREAAYEYGIALAKGKQILMMEKLREQWKEGVLYADGCKCDVR